MRHHLIPGPSRRVYVGDVDVTSYLHPPFLSREQRAALDATEPAHDRAVYRPGVCACGRRCAAVSISATRDLVVCFPCRERAGV